MIVVLVLHFFRVRISFLFYNRLFIYQLELRISDFWSDNPLKRVKITILAKNNFLYAVAQLEFFCQGNFNLTAPFVNKILLHHSLKKWIGIDRFSPSCTTVAMQQCYKTLKCERYILVSSLLFHTDFHFILMILHIHKDINRAMSLYFIKCIII